MPESSQGMSHLAHTSVIQIPKQSNTFCSCSGPSTHDTAGGNLTIATMDDVRGANTVWVTQVTSPQPTNPHGARAPWGSKRRKGEWTSPQFYSILWCAQEESLWHPDDKVSHANSSFIFSASGGDSVWGSSYSRV